MREVGLSALPAEPLTVARYLAARAGSGASIATLRLATSAISKAHEWAKLESPCRDPGVRASLKGWGRRLAKPQRQSGALTADVLAVIRLTAGAAPQARPRHGDGGAGSQERARFDVALVAVLSDAGLRRSEASSLTWGDVQRWDDGSGRITVVRSKTDAEAVGAVVAVTPAAMAGAFRHPAGGRWWWGEGVRAVGVPDRPAGQGHRQSRGAFGLGVLQRPQRAGGHGPAHGPERRPHPRDRTPGPLETGRRHGRPLHPRRVRPHPGGHGGAGCHGHGADGTVAVRTPGPVQRTQLRTMECRLKEWRGIMAKELVYAGTASASTATSGPSEMALVETDPRC